MKGVLALVVGLFSLTTAVPRSPNRIVGGSVTTIDKYPFAAALLYAWDYVNYYQYCGGTILTTRAILTAGHCLYGNSVLNYRVRVGSPWASVGGTVHNPASLTVHPYFSYSTLDNDVGILKTTSAIVYITATVQPAVIAGTNYNLVDNSTVYAIGWGSTTVGGLTSEQLRHVLIWSVNQSVCKSRYAELGYNITDNMLCSGYLDVGGRDQCQGDSGGPLIHNNVIVGICSWGNQCALPRYPGVNTRVSKFTSWIQSNA